MIAQAVRFQSTLPVGGATDVHAVRLLVIRVSIHAPRGGSDSVFAISFQSAFGFNPRSPWGERLSVIRLR